MTIQASNVISQVVTDLVKGSCPQAFAERIGQQLHELDVAHKRINEQQEGTERNELRGALGDLMVKVPKALEDLVQVTCVWHAS